MLYGQSGARLIAGLASGYLGRHVEVGSAELRLGRGFAIDLADVRVYEGREPHGEPILEVERATGHQPWLRLFAGQVLPSSWEVVRPHLRVRLAAEDAPGEADRGLDLSRVRPLELVLREGSVEIERPGQSALRVTDLAIRTTRSGLPVHATGSAGGRLWVDEAALAVFDVSLELWSGELALEGRLDELDLASLPLGAELALRGRGGGRLEARATNGTLEGEVDLDLVDFVAEHPSLSAPIAPSTTRLALAATWDGETLELVARPLELDALVASGELSLGAGRVRAALAFADFSPGFSARGRVHPLVLLARRFQTWESIDQRIAAGRVEDLRIEADLPRATLAESLGFQRKLAPEELVISLRIRDGVYRHRPESSPLEDISGEVLIEGNRLRVRDVRMSREGGWLPRVDVDIDGMHRLAHLPEDERGLPAGPGVGIPGLGAFMRGVGGDDGGGPGLVVLVRDFQVGYPAFLLPIRNARGPLRFPEGRVVVDDVEAVIGGAPGRLSAIWDPDANHVAVRVRYGDGEAPAPAHSPRHWASGEFSLATLPLGRWRLDDVSGRLEATGSRVEVPHFEALFSRGHTQGFGHMELGREDAASFEFFAGTSDGDAAALAGPLGRPEGSISGRLRVDGRFAGELGPGFEFLERADFGLAVLLQEGNLGDLPALMVLARLPSLQGIRGLFGTRLPFDAMSGDLTLRDGALHTDNFALQGPELRMHARGEIDVVSDDLDSEFVLAFLFLQTVDRVIGTVPIVGRWVLGQDKSLVAVTIQLYGPWASPSVRPMAPGAVQTAAGWAMRVVQSGASQLLRVLGGGGSGQDGEADGNGASAGQGP